MKITAKITLVFILLIFTLEAIAQIDVSPDASIDPINQDTVLVAISITNPQSQPIDAFGFTVTYPTSLLSFYGYHNGNALTSGWVFLSAQENTPGQIVVGGADTNAISASGVLIYLLFNVESTGGGSIQLTSFLNDISGATTSDGFINSAVPVELVTFAAEVTGSQVTLSWATASETNNFGFDVEKSTDGELFQKVAFVPGNGTTVQPRKYSFVDGEPLNSRAFYRLKQVDTDGSFEYSKTLEVNVNLPEKVNLFQNYPNPFNPSTKIYYELSEPMNVKVEIFNLLGQKIITLVDAFQNGGYYEWSWNGFDEANNRVESGIYFLRLNTRSLNGEGKTFSKMMTLIE